MGNPAAVWKRLLDEEPLETPVGFEPLKPPKKAKRRLTGNAYEEVLANYWSDRPEHTPDREQFVEATMAWAVYAFLFEDGDHGRGRNHEIRDSSNTAALVERLFASADQMRRTSQKVTMRSVCWWDVQERYHDVARKDIHMLAEDLHEPLLFEAIERLKEAGLLSWHSGVWNLSPSMSRKYILRLKQRGRIFLAPEPNKHCGLSAA